MNGAEAEQVAGEDPNYQVSTDEVDFTVVPVPAQDVEITSPESGDEIGVPFGGSADVPVTGTGEPGAEISVKLIDEDGNFVGTETTTVDEDGNWSVTFEDVEPGEYTAEATQDADGDVSTDETDFSVVADPADDVKITAPIDGDDVEEGDLPVSGTGQPGAEVTVELIDEDGNVVGTETTTVDEDGNWSVTFPDVEPGDYTIEATQDADGETSTDSVSIGVKESEGTDPGADANANASASASASAADADASAEASANADSAAAAAAQGSADSQADSAQDANASAADASATASADAASDAEGDSSTEGDSEADDKGASQGDADTEGGGDAQGNGDGTLPDTGVSGVTISLIGATLLLAMGAAALVVRRQVGQE